MEQLLQELAKTLNISNDAVQTILQNYPQLRQEFVAYYITNMIGSLSETITFLALFIGAAGLPMTHFYTNPKTRFWGKLLATTIISAGLLSVIAFSLQVILAPDITFIKSILKSVK